MNGESAISFKELFSKDIDRNINGVIKANDEKNLDDEVNEYVLTEEICRNLAKFLDAYNDPSNHEQNGAWISGFFGSGKSHLLKMLSHVLGEVPAELVDKGNKPTMSREQIVRAFMGKAEAQDDQMLAGQLEKALTIPATSILFNIDQKADKSNASDMLLYAFVRVFDEARGFYGKNPYVAKFERDLASNGYFEDFKQEFEQVAGKPWSEGRGEAVLWDDEICEAYAAVTGKPEQDSIIQRYEDTYTMTVGDFADDGVIGHVVLVPHDVDTHVRLAAEVIAVEIQASWAFAGLFPDLVGDALPGENNALVQVLLQNLIFRIRDDVDIRAQFAASPPFADLPILLLGHPELIEQDSVQFFLALIALIVELAFVGEDRVPQNLRQPLSAQACVFHWNRLPNV